tara:strand:- start:152 stop:385 length:234 start_codon:yes stop_codon:yes gene_type:complete
MDSVFQLVPMEHFTLVDVLLNLQYFVMMDVDVLVFQMVRSVAVHLMMLTIIQSVCVVKKMENPVAQATLMVVRVQRV